MDCPQRGKEIDLESRTNQYGMRCRYIKKCGGFDGKFVFRIID